MNARPEPIHVRISPGVRPLFLILVTSALLLGLAVGILVGRSGLAHQQNRQGRLDPDASGTWRS